MARRAVIKSAEYLTNHEGQALLNYKGEKIRKVVWAWEAIPDAQPVEAKTVPLGYDKAAAKANAKALLAKQAGVVEAASMPKAYRLEFLYDDGHTEVVTHATAEDATRNKAVAARLYDRPLVACRTIPLQGPRAYQGS